MTPLSRRRAELTVWALCGLVAALALPALLDRAFPYFPDDWQVRKGEAEALALEQMRDLGELPDDPYVESVIQAPRVRERQLQLAELQRTEAPPEEMLDTRLAQDLVTWRVRVFEPASSSLRPSFVARVTPQGELRALQTFVPEDRAPEGEEMAAISLPEARAEAEAFLARHGFRLADYAEPEARRRQLEARTDLTLRFRDLEAALGPEGTYGVEVTFAGDRLTGFSTYVDDPREGELENALQPVALLSQVWIFLPVPLLPIVAIFFLRRYHAGEIGVRRGLEILSVALGAGFLVLVFCGNAPSAGFNLGVLTRQQVTWVIAVQLFLLFFIPLGLMSLLSWSVGEARYRETRGRVLAAFDAFFKGDWANATFAREALVGLAAGLSLTAVVWALGWWMREQGLWLSTSSLFGPWWEDAHLFAVPLVGVALAYTLYSELFGRLFLVSGLSDVLGRWPGRALAVVLGALMFFPPLEVLPVGWSFLPALVVSASLVALLLTYGIFSTLLASFTLFVVSGAVPFLTTADPQMQLLAGIALVVPAVPLLASFRALGSGREFVYRYEDVPPHVRRIAERERQRVELETARGIQSSILPELPPRLQGVDLAHAYLPATEVGGDFYDVLALEDGRLAVAVGDVAGHGVSSGLVMSMAKSALAVQVTFDAEVDSVFRTLNRTVYQTARRRLLTTLCYAVLDPLRRELEYASAGHLFPYRIGRSGEVQALESVAYPLGVRGDLEVHARRARLKAGDTLFLFSDGVVEARAEGSDELYGFERLEESLRRHAGAGPEQLRDGVLADVEHFTGAAPREDDQTVLVLRLPAA